MHLIIYKRPAPTDAVWEIYKKKSAVAVLRYVRQRRISLYVSTDGLS